MSTTVSDIVLNQSNAKQGGSSIIFNQNVGCVKTSTFTPPSGVSTLSFWFYWTNSFVNYQDKYTIFYLQEDNNRICNCQINLADGNLLITGRITNVTITESTWYHVVLLINMQSTTMPTLYVNGVQKTITTYTQTAAISNVTLLVGNGPVGATPFSGYIDEFRLYNKALTQAEITYIYNNVFIPITNAQSSITDSIVLKTIYDNPSQIYSGQDLSGSLNLWNKYFINLAVGGTYADDSTPSQPNPNRLIVSGDTNATSNVPMFTLQGASNTLRYSQSVVISGAYNSMVQAGDAVLFTYNSVSGTAGDAPLTITNHKISSLGHGIRISRTEISNVLDLFKTSLTSTTFKFKYNGVDIFTCSSGGNITATSFNATSDYRIKDNISTLPPTITVDKLNPVSYTNKISSNHEFGFIAHELQDVYPNLVNGEKDGETMQSVNYTGIIPILVNEIKNLKTRVSELESKLSTT